MGSIQGARRPDQLRFQLKHQTGFSLTGMQTAFQLLFRKQRRKVRDPAPQKTRQHGHGRAAGTKLARCDLQQADLSTMGVEQQQPARTEGSQLPAHLIHKLEKQISAQRQSAGKHLMFRRKTDRLHGKTPHRNIRSESIEHGIENAFREQCIRGKREVRTVLLTGTERPDHRCTGALHGLSGRRPCQRIETSAPRIHPVSLEDMHNTTLPAKMADR